LVLIDCWLAGWLTIWLTIWLAGLPGLPALPCGDGPWVVERQRHWK
jgi:hypothetical protein